jgi:hypothetical protein
VMSVRYTATWYDVMQARQQDTHHTHRHVPARPAGLQFSVYAGVIGSKWRSSVLLFAADSDCIPIVGAVKP